MVRILNCIDGITTPIQNHKKTIMKNIKPTGHQERLYREFAEIFIGVECLG